MSTDSLAGRTGDAEPLLETRNAKLLNSSVAKAFRILECFSDENPEMGVVELAGKLGIHKSTVYRFLATMEALEILEKNLDNDKYRLGLKLFHLGSLAMRQRTFQNQARPFLQGMARRSGETVHLATLLDGEIIYLDKIESGETLVSIPSAIGRRLPAHCTGLGKVLLADQSPNRVREIIRLKGLKKFTENTITTAEALTRQLEKIRHQGFAVDDQEMERGLSCVAAPVRNHQGKVAAAISIAGPSIRFEEPERAKLVNLVQEVALSISRRLGYSSVTAGQGQEF